jgi:2-haloalkanoic acid dehalogenase type II
MVVRTGPVSSRPFVFLDLGGTLVDLRGLPSCMATQLEELRLPETEAIAFRWATRTASALPAAQGSCFRSEREIAARALREVFRESGHRVSEDRATRFVRDAWSDFASKCVLQPDVSRGWLQALHSHVVRLGLISDGDSEAVNGLLGHLGLLDVFDSVTVSEEVRAYKPDERVYRAALAALHAEPARSFFVSDSPLDLQGAARLGFALGFIRRSPFSGSEQPPSSSLVLASLQDVDTIVRGFARLGRFQLS